MVGNNHVVLMKGICPSTRGMEMAFQCMKPSLSRVIPPSLARLSTDTPLRALPSSSEGGKELLQHVQLPTVKLPAELQVALDKVVSG